jgi:3-hydroxyisobutyrate dehydrogenase
MGAPMVQVLRAKGVEVVAFDLRAEALGPLVRDHGVVAAGTLAEVAINASTIITMLPTSRHVSDVLFGPVGLTQAMIPGSLVIDMSSGDPLVTKELGERLHKLGHSMVDAPVSGNVTRAAKGDLTIMLGGAEDACYRAEPALAPLARTIYRTGPLGSGQAMKALNNLSSAAGFWIASEVLAIGKRLGLDPATMIDVLNASTGANNSTQNKFKPFVLSGSYQGNFLLSLMAKDLGIAAQLANQTAQNAPLTGLVEQLWAQASQALGPQADHTEVARWVDQSFSKENSYAPR